MSSIDLLKAELINQKTALENKGVVVSTAHTNPSPAEITSAINTIAVTDFSSADATVSDVIAGKTFFAGNSELKTGTNTEISRLYQDIRLLIGGVTEGSNLTVSRIPDGITAIRRYAFYNMKEAISGYYIIPDEVTIIDAYAFSITNITGYSIPSALVAIGASAFSACQYLESAVIPDTVTTLGINVFLNVQNETSIYIGTGINELKQNLFNTLNLITEVNIPENITKIQSANFVTVPLMENMYVRRNELVVAAASTLLTTVNANLKIWVPFDLLPVYYTATNWTRQKNKLCAQVEIGTQYVFPTFTNPNYTPVWYSNLNDISSQTNPITAPFGPGTYYCRITTI